MKPSTTMVALPMKGMVDSDWIHPLRHYIASVYGPGDHFIEEINTIHRLRQDVRGSATDAIGRDLVYRYYGQLELLDLRIPVNERGCRMPFTWSDSFTGDSTTQYSLAFEKASLLFNLATINCRIGADSDDVKVAYNSFQASAGVYNYVMENFLHAPSTDLAQDTVKALSKLMLAQAQESFLDKMMQSGSKPLIVAKVAKAASQMYKTAAEALQAVYQNKTWGEKSWWQYSFVKASYFLAVACDYQAEGLEGSGKYGEAIAFGQCACQTYQEASKLTLPSTFNNMAPLIKTRIDAAKHKLQTLEKDNQFVYHATVLPVSTLPDISPMEAAKPTSMNDLYKEQKDVGQIIGRDIFENLIPLSIHEKSSMYSEEKAKLLRNEGEKVEVADEEMSSALEFLDLPRSLRMLKNGGDDNNSHVNHAEDIPAIVKDWASEMSGAAQIDFSKVESRRAEIFQKVKGAEQKVENEQTESMDKKRQYGDRWTQSSAMSMSSGIINDIQRVKESLNNGANSDAKVKTMAENSQQDIAVLKSGPNSTQLQNLFAAQDTASLSSSSVQNLLDLDQSDDENVKGWISETENALTKLNKIQKERKNIFAEFKEKVHKDDISSLLILNGKVPSAEEQLFKTELAKFEPYQSRLDSSIHHQKQTLNELTSSWKKVLSNDSIKKQTSDREARFSQRSQLIERLRAAYNSWKDAQEGVSKGAEFYNELDATASNIVSNTNQFVNNRQEERNRLVRELGGSFSSPSPGGSLTQDQLRSQLSELSLGARAPPPPPPPKPQAAQPPPQPAPQPAPQLAPNAGGSPWDNLAMLDSRSASNAPPPKPPKPTDSYHHQSPSPQMPQPHYSQHQYQQQQPEPFRPSPQQGYSGYGTPSVYDSSFYQSQPPPPPSQHQYQQHYQQHYQQQQPPAGYQPQYSYQQPPQQPQQPQQRPQPPPPPPPQGQHQNQWWT